MRREDSEMLERMPSCAEVSRSRGEPREPVRSDDRRLLAHCRAPLGEGFFRAFAMRTAAYAPPATAAVAARTPRTLPTLDLPLERWLEGLLLLDCREAEPPLEREALPRELRLLLRL